MIPFAKIIKLKNEFDTWTKGDEILAYDSQHFAIKTGNNFKDNNGKNCTVTNVMYGNVGVMPSPGAKPFKYGNGINMASGMIYGNGLGSSYLTASWTMDCWVSYNGNNTANFLPFYPLMNDSGGSLSVEFQTRDSPGTGNLACFNGSSYVADIGTNLPVLNDQQWHHFCMMYDFSAKRWYVYVDGVQVGNVACNYTAFTTATFAAAVWGNYRNRASTTASIERFRLRAGLSFQTSGFSISDSSLYPK